MNGAVAIGWDVGPPPGHDALAAVRGLAIGAGPRPTAAAVLEVDADRWAHGAVDGYALDDEADALAAEGLRPRWAHGPTPAAAEELAIRCQRWLPWRNRAASTPAFERALAALAAAHDRRKPLVRADHNHALDAWRWMLRLEPGAAAAPQLAILFHDVERLTSEADRRVEHLAADLAAFKRAHARAGASIARRMLAAAEVDPATARRAADLLAAGDDPAAALAGDPELRLVEEADALSFFSLNSAGYLDYYGAAHTRAKLAWSLARLGDRGRRALAGVRLRDDVARLFAEVPR